MFDIKYRFYFKDGDVKSLYGQDYYGDKRCFYEYHHRMLEEVRDKASDAEFPIKIIDEETGEEYQVQTLEEFHEWLKTHR